MSGVKERLKEFISKEGLSVRKFESSINASYSYVNSISRSIGIDKIQNISEVYPKLNLTWLLTGKGEMTLKEYTLNDELSPVLVVDYLQKRNDELMSDEIFREFILAKHKKIETDNAHSMLNKQLDKLKKILEKKEQNEENKND